MSTDPYVVQRSERMEKVHLFICAIAAFATTAGFIVLTLTGQPPEPMLAARWVSLSIVIFYCVGRLVKAFLFGYVFAIPDTMELEETEASSEQLM